MLDADIAWETHFRKLVIGLLYKLGSSLIHWSSNLQETVAVSTTKAEHRALSKAAREICYLWGLFIGYKFKKVNQ